MLLNLVAKIKFSTLLHIIIWLLMAILLLILLIPVWFDFILIVSCTWKKSYHIATNVCSRKSATTFGDLPEWLLRIIRPALDLSWLVRNTCHPGMQQLRFTVMCGDYYRQTSNIRRTWVGNDIVDHWDVVRASRVGAAPTTSSFST